MTEAKAREVFGEIVQENNELRSMGRAIHHAFPIGDKYVMWRFDLYAPKETSLDGIFTSLQLRAIAWWMDNMGGARNG
jgi:hypothetical protein